MHIQKILKCTLLKKWFTFWTKKPSKSQHPSSKVKNLRKVILFARFVFLQRNFHFSKGFFPYKIKSKGKTTPSPPLSTLREWHFICWMWWGSKYWPLNHRYTKTTAPSDELLVILIFKKYNRYFVIEKKEFGLGNFLRTTRFNQH